MSSQKPNEDSQPSACRKTVDASIVRKAIIGLFVGTGAIASVSLFAELSRPKGGISTKTLMSCTVPSSSPDVISQPISQQGAPKIMRLQPATQPCATAPTDK